MCACVCVFVFVCVRACVCVRVCTRVRVLFKVVFMLNSIGVRNLGVLICRVADTQDNQDERLLYLIQRIHPFPFPLRYSTQS